jgi:hypothetical protein
MGYSEPQTNIFYSNSAEVSQGSGESRNVESPKKSSRSPQEVGESREKFYSSEFGYEDTKNGRLREEILDSGKKSPDLLLRNRYSSSSPDLEMRLDTEQQVFEDFLISTERKLVPAKEDLS